LSSDEDSRHTAASGACAPGAGPPGGEIRASEIVHRDGRWYLSLTLAVASIERVSSADAA
jgi:putative transposase